jgi:hypothetical protein
MELCAIYTIFWPSVLDTNNLGSGLWCVKPCGSQQGSCHLSVVPVNTLPQTVKLWTFGGFSEFRPEGRINKLRFLEGFLAYWDDTSSWTWPFLYKSLPIHYLVFIVHRLRFWEVFSQLLPENILSRWIWKGVVNITNYFYFVLFITASLVTSFARNSL